MMANCYFHWLEIDSDPFFPSDIDNVDDVAVFVVAVRCIVAREHDFAAFSLTEREQSNEHLFRQ